MATTQDIFQTGMALIDKPFLHFTDMLRVLPDLVRLQSYRSVYGYVSQFIENEFLRRCFSFHPLLIGGNPPRCPLPLCPVSTIWNGNGASTTPKEAPARIVDGFGRLLDELGVQVHLNTAVQEILIEDNSVRGVRLGRWMPHSRRCGFQRRCGVDLPQPEPARPNGAPTATAGSKARNTACRCSSSTSAPKNGTTPAAAWRTTISSSANGTKGCCREIFAEQELPEDFSLYSRMPTLTDPSMAPEGCEAFYVLSPVPDLNAQIDWRVKAGPTEISSCSFWKKIICLTCRPILVAEHRIDPLHFQDTLNSYLGSAFSVEPTLLQSAWFRPHNRSEDLANLYFVGAGTHPGAGLPGRPLFCQNRGWPAQPVGSPVASRAATASSTPLA
jgi:phytoene desaturase